MTTMVSIPATAVSPPGNLLVWCCLSLAGASLLLLLCARTLLRLPGHPRPSLRMLLRDVNGTATIEFALLFPFALFLMLVLTQVALLMGGHIFVHYAAHAAARSAVVKIPADYTFAGEPPNAIALDDTSRKYDAIRMAAVYSLVPVAGRSSDGVAPTEAYTAGLRQYYQAHGRTPPSWIDSIAADRLRYADANTQVALVRTTMVSEDDVVLTELEGEQLHTFGPREAITVRVAHRLNLSVPYVRAIFADERSDTTDGGAAYTLVTAQSTLINHGIPDLLPREPTLPRWTPD